MRTICADIAKEKGMLNRFFSACIGAGRAGEVMRYPVMEQLKRIQRECAFRYIRFHGLFHEEMNVVRRDENGKLTFCFQYVDLLFDMLLDIGLRPVVELGLMPDTMAKEKEYVFWWKMNKSMPKDISEWEALVETLVRHFTLRYGKEEVKTWYFEVWNEPNHPGFFTEYKNMNAYFSLYDSAALAVKRVCAEYQVGGPATAGMVWLDEMVAHCREKDIPLDFLTSHSYGVKGDFDPDGNAIVVLKKVDKVSDEIRHHGAKCKAWGIPLIITEWSSSYSSTDGIHDSYFSAPYILRTLKRCEGFADMMSYWTFTDIFEENSPPTEPFHGGFGLMSMQSLPKPSYYAYCFLSRLGETELLCDDEDAYVCRSEKGVQMLFWNVQKPDLADMGNRKYFGRKLPAGVLDDAQITLCGLVAGKEYTILCETVGEGKGDVFTAFLDGGNDALSTREKTAALAEMVKPEKREFRMTADEDGVLRFSLAQKENQVDLVEIFI